MASLICVTASLGSASFYSALVETEKTQYHCLYMDGLELLIASISLH